MILYVFRCWKKTSKSSQYPKIILTMAPRLLPQLRSSMQLEFGLSHSVESRNKSMDGERYNFVVERRGERGMVHPFEQARKYGEPLSDYD